MDDARLYEQYLFSGNEREKRHTKTIIKVTKSYIFWGRERFLLAKKKKRVFEDNVTRAKA